MALLVAAGCAKTDTDRTLTVAEYLERDVPDPQADWTIGQCVAAAKALAAVAGADPRQLPRSNSRKSGMVFGRIRTVCIRHLTAPTDIRLRMRNFVQTIEMGRLLLKAYGKAVGAGHSYAPELMEVWGSFLLMWAKGIPVSLAFLDTIPADDPSYEKRMAGLTQVLSGVAVSVHTALLLIADRSHPQSARVRLALRLEEALPVLLRSVGNDRAAILLAISNVAEAADEAQIRTPLRRAIRTAKTKAPTGR